MEFKASEILAIVVALAIPLAIFTALLIPGAVGGVYSFVLREDVRPYIFYGGAALVFGVLALRIYRRVRPKTPRDKGSR